MSKLAAVVKAHRNLKEAKQTYQQAVIQTHAEGCSFEVIGEVLGVPRQTVWRTAQKKESE